MANWNEVLAVSLNGGDKATVYYRLSPTLRQNGLFVYKGKDDANPAPIVEHGGDASPQFGNYVISNDTDHDQVWYLADWQVVEGDPPLPALSHQASFWGDGLTGGIFYSPSPGGGVGGQCSDVLAALYVSKGA